MTKTGYSKNILRKRTYGGSEYVKLTVLLTDFLLLNLLFTVLLWLDNDLVPRYFSVNTKISVLLMNFTMVIAEYSYHTIIERRLVGYMEIASNSLKLVLTQSVLMYVALRFMDSRTGFFRYMLIFTGSFYAIILVSRIVGRWGLSKLREHGMNSQTVLFVGHDPALVQLYESLTQSASIGYRVLGYYLDQEIKNGPKALKRLGNMEDLKAQLGRWDEDPTAEIGLHEIFCSLPHDEGDLVRRIIRSCDKSVIRFYYVPRIFEDRELELKLHHLGNYTLFTNRVEPLV